MECLALSWLARLNARLLMDRSRATLYAKQCIRLATSLYPPPHRPALVQGGRPSCS